MFCSIVIGAVTNRRPFWARAVTLACFLVLLLLCANLVVANEARADLVGGTVDAVGGSQAEPTETEPPTSKTPTDNTSSDQPSASPQPAPVEEGSTGDGGTSHAPADPVGTVGDAAGGAVGETVGTAQPVVESAGAVTTDATSGVLEPVSGAVEGVTEPVGQAVAPVGEAVTPIVQPVGGVVEPVVEEAEPVLRPVVDAVEPVVSPVTEAVEPVLRPVKKVTEPVLDPVAGVTDPVVDVVLPDPNAPDGGTTQNPDGGGTPGGTPEGTPGGTPEGTPGGSTPEGTHEPRSAAVTPHANDGAIVSRDDSGRASSDHATSGPTARHLVSEPALTRYAAAHTNSPVQDTPSAAVAAVSGARSASSDIVTDQPQRSEPWFFEAVREGLDATVAAAVGSSGFSSEVPFSAIEGIVSQSASFKSAGSAFATGLACFVLLLYSISRARLKWAPSRFAAPSPPLRLITERPG